MLGRRRHHVRLRIIDVPGSADHLHRSRALVRMRHLILLSSFVAVSCVESAGSSAAPIGEIERHPLGKADGHASCAAPDGNACGGQSTGACWCDDACTEHGDCCADWVDVCGCDEGCGAAPEALVDYPGLPAGSFRVRADVGQPSRAYSWENDPYHPQKKKVIRHGEVITSMACIIEGENPGRVDLNCEVHVPTQYSDWWGQQIYYSSINVVSQITLAESGEFDFYADDHGIVSPDSDRLCARIQGTVHRDQTGQLDISIHGVEAKWMCNATQPDMYTVSTDEESWALKSGFRAVGADQGYWITFWSEAHNRFFLVETPLQLVESELPRWEGPDYILFTADGEQVGTYELSDDYPILDADVVFIGTDENGDLMIER